MPGPFHDLKLRAAEVAGARAASGDPMTAQEIRAALGITDATVFKAVRGFLAARCIPIKRRIARAATYDEVQKILDLARRGYTNRRIGEAVGRTAKGIENIIKTARALGEEVKRRNGNYAIKDPIPGELLTARAGMTEHAKADRAIEAEQRRARLAEAAAGQGDDEGAPPPWKKVIPPDRFVASLRQHYRSHEAAYEAAQRDIFRRRHGVERAA